MNKKKIIFSFFSGSGFLDLGFETNGFDIDLVNEFSPEFMRAYKYSREKMDLRKPRFGYFNIDINEFLSVRKDELHRYMKESRSDGNLVGFIGGPPCPDFSIAGKNRGRNGDNGKLSKSYADLIITMQPDFFLFENVKGLWKTARHREFYEELKRSIMSAGYSDIMKPYLWQIEIFCGHIRDPKLWCQSWLIEHDPHYVYYSDALWDERSTVLHYYRNLIKQESATC